MHYLAVLTGSHFLSCRLKSFCHPVTLVLQRGVVLKIVTDVQVFAGSLSASGYLTMRPLCFEAIPLSTSPRLYSRHNIRSFPVIIRNQELNPCGGTINLLASNKNVCVRAGFTELTGYLQMGTFSSWRSSTSTLLKCSNFKCVYFRHLTQTISLAGCRIFTANTNVANLYQRYGLPSTLGALRGDKLPCALVSCQISLIQRTLKKGRDSHPVPSRPKPNKLNL